MATPLRCTTPPTTAARVARATLPSPSLFERLRAACATTDGDGVTALAIVARLPRAAPTLVTPQLFVAGAAAAADLPTLRALRVRAVLLCTDSQAAPDELLVHRVPLHDADAPLLQSAAGMGAVDWVVARVREARLRGGGDSVLVACQCGINRSPTVALAAARILDGWTDTELVGAAARVRADRGLCLTNSRFLHELADMRLDGWTAMETKEGTVFIQITLQRDGWSERPLVLSVRRGASILELIKAVAEARWGGVAPLAVNQYAVWDAHTLAVSLKNLRKDTQGGAALVLGTRTGYAAATAAAPKRRRV